MRHSYGPLVLGVALFSTALPTLMLFWPVRTVGATNTSLLAFFMPVSAILLGVILLGRWAGVKRQASS